METTVLHNQNFIDISIQSTGQVDNIWKIAVANSRSPSDMLLSGQLLIVPDDVSTSFDVLKYFSAKSIKPATGSNAQELEFQIPQFLPLGSMSIGSTFTIY